MADLSFGADLIILAVGIALMMAGLFAAVVIWTVIVKMRHPKWSWRRCAKYTTLIQ